MKRRLAIILSLTMFLCSGLTVNAMHFNKDNKPCNNTYYTLSDHATLATTYGTHNITCSVTYYTMSHSKSCASCYTGLGMGPNLRCTEVHTCGNYYKTCTGTFQ